MIDWIKFRFRCILAIPDLWKLSKRLVTWGANPSTSLDEDLDSIPGAREDFSRIAKKIFR